MHGEADECVDHLEYLRDTRIRDDAALLQEVRELAKIFARSVSTARHGFHFFHFFHFSTFAVDWPLWTPYISLDARLC